MDAIDFERIAVEIGGQCVGCYTPDALFIFLQRKGLFRAFDADADLLGGLGMQAERHAPIGVDFGRLNGRRSLRETKCGRDRQ